MNTEAIESAIKRIGGAKAVTSLIDAVSGEKLTTHAVRLWVKTGVPAKWVLWIEKESGISRHLLSRTPLPTESVVTVFSDFNRTNRESQEVKSQV